MRLVFLDGDRCYWRTDRFMDIIYEALEHRGISRDTMARLKQETEASGGAFDTIEALRKNYDRSLVDELIQDVEREATLRQTLPYDDERCLLMPGIRELVEVLPATQRVVLTRGGEELQLLKLKGIAGIDTARDLYEITDREDKGRSLLEGFDAKTGQFAFSWIRNARTPVQATSVVLLEDKASAFAGFEQLSEKMTGYWYQDPSEALLPSQALPAGMELPKNVTIVDRLETVQRALS